VELTAFATDSSRLVFDVHSSLGVLPYPAPVMLALKQMNILA